MNPGTYNKNEPLISQNENMNIFFDVDYTILGIDDTLRPGTKETFRRIIQDGHRIHIWSGLGQRWEVIKQHSLQEFASGVYEKPLHDFEERLEELGIPMAPDLVIDDYPEVVSAFGGIWVPPYYFKRIKDDQMERVYQIIQDVDRKGYSKDNQYFQKGDQVSL